VLCWVSLVIMVSGAPLAVQWAWCAGAELQSRLAQVLSDGRTIVAAGRCHE
jgi:hypothetical protein